MLSEAAMLYIELMNRLNTLYDEGKEDSPEATQLCLDANKPWEEMLESEREFIRLKAAESILEEWKKRDKE